MGPFISQIAVDFIGNDDEIVLFCKRCQLHERIPVHDGTGGIVRVPDKDSFCPGSDFLFQFFHGEFEFIFLIGRYQYRFPTCNGYAGRISQVRRVRDEHFISRVQESSHDDTDGFGYAHGHHDFILRVVVHVIPVMEKFCNFFPQFQKAPVGGIGGLLPFQTFDAGINDFIRRRIVRFPYAQGNDIFHGAGKVKEFTDARERHLFDIGCEFFIPIHWLVSLIDCV